MADELCASWLGLDDLGTACPGQTETTLVGMLMRGLYDPCLRGCAGVYKAAGAGERQRVVAIAVQCMVEKGEREAALKLLDRCYGSGVPRGVVSLKARVLIAMNRAAAAVELCQNTIAAGKASADAALLDVLETHVLEALPAHNDTAYTTATEYLDSHYICFVATDSARVELLRKNVAALAARAAAAQPRQKPPPKPPAQPPTAPVPEPAPSAPASAPAPAPSPPVPSVTQPRTAPAAEWSLQGCVRAVAVAFREGDYTTLGKVFVALLAAILVLKKAFARKQTITL
eukprot:TRINITY_DN7624_c0_g1_i1.p1 TRINITY_DN7624_c0_g1~~TRINITY_DN7624_c0_g1_i1.p1  ORF type:complete len:287 (+),score=58.68 TRINITY_DN7624_c0_g1_i1:40-900(+)